MMPRSASILAVLSLCVALTSCAEGGGATVPLLGDGGATTTGFCGDNFVDTAAGESCECPAGATGPCVVNDKTCSDLSPGDTGTLLCDHALCMYIPTMCMPASGGAGNGTGGAGG